MEFEEMLRQDFDDIFFNTEEFAENIVLSGLSIRAVIADYKSGKNSPAKNSESIVRKILSVQVQSSDLPVELEQNEKVEITKSKFADGIYMCLDFKREGLTTKLTLEKTGGLDARH